MKEIQNTPEWLKGSTDSKFKIFDMGNLSSLKNWMIENKDYDNPISNSSKSNDNWNGAYSYDDYIKLLDEGDETVMKQIKTATQKSVKELSKKYEEVIRNYKFDVTGEFFDIGLVVTGVPESWLEPVKEETVRVELLIDGTFPDGSDLEVCRKNAGRVLGMVKILENHGVEVKITQFVYAKGCGNGKTKNIIIYANVKNYDEPINYKKCSALITPTFLRRCYMRVAEVTLKGELERSYGRVKGLSNTTELISRNSVDKLERRLFK